LRTNCKCQTVSVDPRLQLQMTNNVQVCIYCSNASILPLLLTCAVFATVKCVAETSYCLPV